eukprot:SAG11_NODE_648_length_7939_cov_84.614129_7_plen_98_part_00
MRERVRPRLLLLLREEYEEEEEEEDEEEGGEEERDLRVRARGMHRGGRTTAKRGRWTRCSGAGEARMKGGRCTKCCSTSCGKSTARFFFFFFFTQLS